MGWDILFLLKREIEIESDCEVSVGVKVGGRLCHFVGNLVFCDCRSECRFEVDGFD